MAAHSHGWISVAWGFVLMLASTGLASADTESEVAATAAESVATAPVAMEEGDEAAIVTDDFSAEIATSVTDDFGQDISLFPMLAKVSVALGVVVLLAWGAAAIMRRSSLGRSMATDGSVRILERNWLAHKKAVYLVEVGDRTLALGVTEEQITCLSTWEQGELELPTPATGESFAEQFRSLLKRSEGQRVTELDAAEVAS
ncbi:MAG: flagellar biosynthetic protein FliO [Candidatus Latescibacterota bacterium]|nr:flagellar biosynthetic protein FliO [Candidatus Latescibacterota bacterium]